MEAANDEESSTETWKVTLSNDANAGSAIYEATVQTKNSRPSGEVASIKIRFIDSN